MKKLTNRIIAANLHLILLTLAVLLTGAPTVLAEAVSYEPAFDESESHLPIAYIGDEGADPFNMVLISSVSTFLEGGKLTCMTVSTAFTWRDRLEAETVECFSESAGIYTDIDYRSLGDGVEFDGPGVYIVVRNPAEQFANLEALAEKLVTTIALESQPGIYTLPEADKVRQASPVLNFSSFLSKSSSATILVGNSDEIEDSVNFGGVRAIIKAVKTLEKFYEALKKFNALDHCRKHSDEWRRAWDEVQKYFNELLGALGKAGQEAVEKGAEELTDLEKILKKIVDEARDAMNKKP